jgi:proteic killer suppression protein
MVVQRRNSAEVPFVPGTAERKLQMLDSAKDLNDLRVPPGNRLEKLIANRRGQYSIRINDQWRVCVRWRADGPWDVEIVDYH